jgi:PAS domain S-box-containing protein
MERDSNHSTRRLKQTRWILIGIVLAGLVTDARALDPNRLPSQYVREQWTTETRFPGGAVNGIAQTADGYLWIGTDRGLIRFDGFNFRPVSFASIATASNVPILQLLTDAGGKLWIRPQGADLVRQRDGKFESVRYGPDAITALSKDNHGGVLASDIEQGTLRFMEDHVQKLGPSSPPVISLAETADGKIWLGTLGDGLFFLTGGQATRVNAGLPDRKINCLLAIGSDELWVGTGTGLYRGNGTGFRRLELPSFLGNVQVLSLLRDRDSNIWVGTTRGLLRINGKGISFSEENELRGDGGITVLFEDREGNLWIGGARGLGRIRDSAFVTYSSVSDRRFEHNGPIYVDPEGRTWFARAQGGLYVLQNGRVQPVTSIPPNEVVYSISGRADVVWAGRQRGGLTRLRFRDGAIASQSYTEANGLAQNSAYVVYETRDGSVWTGTLNGGVSKFKDGHFTTYTTTNGLASDTVSSILETGDGAMWFATPSGLSSFSNGQWKTYTTAEGLPSPEVNCLFEDSSGTLWSGTSAGLASFASSHFQVPDESPDVLREQILGIADDKSGRFWIATSHHVLRVPRDKLLSGVVKAVDVQEYDQADGLESTEGVKRSRSVVSDSAGRIWFSLSSGLSVVDPSQINDNSVPALPHIEAITADDNIANLAAFVQIPPSPRRITFEYTGLSLAVPGRIRFRYLLEGFDRSWSQPVAAREAVYTNLGPGSYRFRLVASNSEGLWNGPETAIALNVAPAYYQTYWFRLLCVAAFLAFLWGLHQLRVHQLRREERKLSEAIETIPAMAWIAGPDGALQFVNRRWVEYTGLSQLGESEEIRKVAIHPDDLDRIDRRMDASFASGEPFEEEMRIRRTDGEYRWFLCRAVPLRDRRGKVVKWYGAATDIQDRKRAEELQANLAHTNRVSILGELVASISHELSQPITATTNNAKASLRWLQRDPPDLTQVRKGTEKIIEAGTFASEIINRLRSLYKKTPAKRELVTINEVIGEMVRLLRGEANEYAVSIRTDLAADLPKITGDRVQLQQVLMNLMLNAIEAMKETGGVLTIKTGPGEGGEVLISVSDTGVGLPTGRADEVFDAFFTTKPQGSGMGLAISRSIVESHGGRLWATSHDGRGATFHFTLPTAVVEVSAAT